MDAAAPPRDARSRHDDVRAVIEALSDIERIATEELKAADTDSQDSGEAWATRRLERQGRTWKRIDDVVARLTAANQVAMFGLSCRSLLGVGHAGDEDYDLVLDYAYFICVRRLHSAIQPDSQYWLEWLERKSQLQGGDATLFYEITGHWPNE